jgi:hypothetical protein
MTMVSAQLINRSVTPRRAEITIARRSCLEYRSYTISTALLTDSAFWTEVPPNFMMSFMQVQLSVTMDLFFSKGMLHAWLLERLSYQNIKVIQTVTCI